MYVIEKQDLLILNNDRPIGISGHLRIKNQDFLIEQCIKTVLTFLDELIITFNDCDDNTEIVLKKWNNHPKIKIYKYPHKVYASPKAGIPYDKKHTLSNYYNFGLTKITYKFYMKIDCDQFYDIKTLSEIKRCLIRKSKKYDFLYNFNCHQALFLFGLNIVNSFGRHAVYIGSRFIKNPHYFSPINGGGDHFIIQPTSSTFYVDSEKDNYSIESMSFVFTMDYVHFPYFCWIHIGDLKYDTNIEEKNALYLDDNKKFDLLEWKYFKKNILIIKNSDKVWQIMLNFIIKLFCFIMKINIHRTSDYYLKTIQKLFSDNDIYKYYQRNLYKIEPYINEFKYRAKIESIKKTSKKY